MLSRYPRLILALIFLAAAPQKIVAPADFALSLESYHILPTVLLNPVAITLPWLEIMVAMLLLCEVWMTSCLLLTNAMLFAFLAAIGSAYLRGIDVNCGCFSSSAVAAGNMTWYIVRDTVFVCLGLFTAWQYRSRQITS